MDMAKVKNFFTQEDKYAKHCGIELLEVAKGYAKAKMDIKDFHLNGVKMVHGGAIFTLADFVFAAASNSHGRASLGINTSMSYLKGAFKGTLFAEAKEVSLNYKLATYIVTITNESNTNIAVFQGTVYRKEDMLDLSKY